MAQVNNKIGVLLIEIFTSPFFISDAVKVPVCLLVAEGGPGTLETVQQAILNNIPIIIVQVCICGIMYKVSF